MRKLIFLALLGLLILAGCATANNPEPNATSGTICHTARCSIHGNSIIHINGEPGRLADTGACPAQRTAGI